MNVLLLNQAFHPDVVSSAQHASDLAKELSARGHKVTVVASRRAYDNPATRFPASEDWQGVRIIRIGCTAFGKGAKWRRAVDFGSYIVICFFRLLMLPRFDVVVAMTSPPLLSVVASAFVRLRGGRLFLWVMDLHPDQAVAAGWLGGSSPVTRALDAFFRSSLKAADRIAVLDRFMLKRLLAKGVSERKVRIIPPWAHNHAVFYDDAGRKAFRGKHGLDGKYVVMYSGNHSPCHPLETLLRAAERLAGDPRIAFCFVGGGSEFEHVQTFAKAKGLKNVVCVPYQPLGNLSASLSAADLHVVVMGEAFVGIVHACKIYNILTLGIPLLYIGPPESHVVDLLPPSALGRWAYLAKHGETDRVAEHILASRLMDVRAYRAAETEVGAKFAQGGLIPRMAGFILGTGSWTQDPSSRTS